MNELIINIPGNPISKKRPRFARRGKFVTTYNAQESEEGKFICLMQSQLNGHKPIPAGTPIKLNIRFFMPIPSSISQKKRNLLCAHTKKPDLDNLIKFVKDCFNGIVWNDDSQVSSIEALKMYADNPQTVVTVMWE
jgi:Holliday junction resolvase RusA-like endonuclease